MRASGRSWLVFAFLVTFTITGLVLVAWALFSSIGIMISPQEKVPALELDADFKSGKNNTLMALHTKMKEQNAPAIALQDPGEIHIVEQSNREPALADGCRYVFLDVGGNMGMQTRKVFEANRVNGCIHHKNSKPLEGFRVPWKDGQMYCYKSIFNVSFGIEAQRARPEWGMCVFLFEPNSVHTQRLKELEASYRKQGWRVTAFTDTAIGPTDGYTNLYRDQDEQPGDPYYKDGVHPAAISASTVTNHGRGFRKVKQVDLARWVLENVASRTIPEAPQVRLGEPPAPPPFVLMKMDTEGAEHTVLPRLVFSGALCSIDVAMVEYHYRTKWAKNLGERVTEPEPGLHANVTGLMKLLEGCKTKVMDGDDESGMDKVSKELPLP